MATPTPLSRNTVLFHRGWVIGVAVVAIVLGLIGLIFPGTSLVAVAIVFGIALVVVGLRRIVHSYTASDLTRGMRWFAGILGALTLVAGILCWIDPFRSLSVLGYLIGFAWIFEGASSLIGGAVGYVGGARWLTIVAGVVSLLAGVVMILLPLVALSAFLTVGSIVLIVIGVTMLLLLPRRAAM
ncbi:HdeD family acid-resistance protein [Frondihabitans australicus]|uniref:Uncharacterized membrane protein HdeD (DUF308 family) n=1 Tax=Frondihabitans australicus TaxID=386892 RepID=A0A495IK69_9MICO|nr:DUF308 domain-containing protein [Frondihabitans australicus]RKR76374.1 uncharacterized membrane protein HdeD (DUF308 family) [Frondihabitans australicus]